MERESEIVDRGSIIATINTYSAGLLARVVLALHHVFHTITDKIHRELHRVAEATQSL